MPASASGSAPGVGTPLVTLSEDAAIERLVRAAAEGAVTVRAPLLRAVAGSHRSLLDLLASAFGEGALVVDGQAGPPGGLDPERPHDLDLRLAECTGLVSAAKARQWIETARALGSHALSSTLPAAERPVAGARLLRLRCVAGRAGTGPLSHPLSALRRRGLRPVRRNRPASPGRRGSLAGPAAGRPSGGAGRSGKCALCAAARFARGGPPLCGDCTPPRGARVHRPGLPGT